MEIEIARQIGQVVRKQRKASGLTQSQLAEKAHVDRSLIIRLESGEAKSLYPEKLLSILSALDLKMTIEPQNQRRLDIATPLAKDEKDEEKIARGKARVEKNIVDPTEERVQIVHGIDADLLLPRHIKKRAK